MKSSRNRKQKARRQKRKNARSAERDEMAKKEHPLWWMKKWTEATK